MKLPLAKLLRKQEYESNKRDVALMQKKYMMEAQQRLELQKTMAEMLAMIKGSRRVPIRRLYGHRLGLRG